MKELYLIRHAKSSWSDPDASDFFRKLSKRGKRDAPFMAAKLAERGVHPDLIISSPATRARKTAQKMAEAVAYKDAKIFYNDSIYSSSTLELYRVLRTLSDTFSTVFFIGHNYAITDLAEDLTGKSIGNIPTCGIVAMKCNIESWRSIAKINADLLFFDYPKRYSELR